MSCDVCSNALVFAAYGACQHPICNTCCVRLRFGQKDLHCVLCRQRQDMVVITQASAEAMLSIEDIRQLEKEEGSSEKCKELRYIKEINAYSVPEAYDETRLLCSYTHPILKRLGKEAEGLVFNTLQQLRVFISEKFNLYFCDLCLEFRQVLIPLQRLYSAQTLREHYNGQGKYCEDGFKGHPSCIYCNKRLYDVNFHYSHMETVHFRCDICKAQRPSVYDYFNTYEDLEQHFRDQHFQCQHQTCLDAKFIVFGTKYEFMQHLQNEHDQTPAAYYAQLQRTGSQRQLQQWEQDLTNAISNNSNQSYIRSSRQETRIGYSLQEAEVDDTLRDLLVNESSIQEQNLNSYEPFQNNDMFFMPIASQNNNTNQNQSSRQQVNQRFTQQHQRTASQRGRSHHPHNPDYGIFWAPRGSGRNRTYQQNQSQRQQLPQNQSFSQQNDLQQETPEQQEWFGTESTNLNQNQSKMSQQMVSINKHIWQQITQRVPNGELLDSINNAIKSEFVKNQMSAMRLVMLFRRANCLDLLLQMCGLLPVAKLRRELLNEFERQIDDDEFWHTLNDEAQGRLGSRQSILTKIRETYQVHCWFCHACSLINAPEADLCQRCGKRKVAVSSQCNDDSSRKNNFKSRGSSQRGPNMLRSDRGRGRGRQNGGANFRGRGRGNSGRGRGYG
eukprot:TRINITY_DN9016_c2_g1_i5.p1 TRINITY_DN9016_c2_g1~~TRINITY_DN9016_c2_g1_i5.p1  ORF type:complete len:708 (-),score=37.88 TRINITY_DN9016_c2_g1_i5:1407-3413(-)